MRVLLVTNIYPTPQNPSVGSFVAAQVESLRELGVHIDVLHLERVEVGRGVYRSLGRMVRAAVAEHEPELVHVSYGGITAYIVTRAVRDRPVVVTYHGTDLLGATSDGPLGDALALRVGVVASRRAARRAAGIVVVSRTLLETLPRSVDRSRVWIVPMGVDMSRFRPLDRGDCQRRLAWDPSRSHILFPSSPTRPEKRFALANAAVEALRRRTTEEVELHVLEGLPNDEVPTWLNAADVILLTSTHEGSPVVVKEALACSVPIVSVDVGDVRERITGAGSSSIADATPERLADALARALEGNRIDTRDQIAELSLEAVARRISEIYTNLAGAAPAPAGPSA